MCPPSGGDPQVCFSYLYERNLVLGRVGGKRFPPALPLDFQEMMLKL
jgi:hypothetical protein